MTHSAKILADSMSPDGVRLVTLEVVYPRYIIAELNTHRMISKSSASSRAIPVAKMLKRFREDLHVPIHWGKNQKGMQAEEELSPELQAQAAEMWRMIAPWVDAGVVELMNIGVHKQVANRWLEPGMWMTTVLTGTEWDNFFHLRNHPAAHPEFKRLAEVMLEALIASDPKPVNYGDWHTPYVEADEAFDLETQYGKEFVTKVSAGRCARVSYLTQDGRRDPHEDVALVNEKLLPPGHMAPLEHVARPAEFGDSQYAVNGEFLDLPEDDFKGRPIGETFHEKLFYGNFRGWVQLRKQIPHEHDILGAG